MSLAFPVKTVTKITEESKVSIVLHAYSNRLFILVAEIDAGSTGTLVEFRKETVADLPTIGGGGGGDADIVYDIHVLFGVERPEILLAARVLGTKIHESGISELPIIFGVGLKRFQKPILEDIAQNLISLLKGL